MALQRSTGANLINENGLKETYYLRNFASLMLEAFTFAFALAIFSPENVLPVYVSMLSSKPIYIALISVIYYGVSNASSIFSCVIGVNAKSPKWTSVVVCFFQRVGFCLIFLSTFWVEKNPQLALFIFFASLAMYSASAGMSNPLFAQMISVSIHRNVSTFYGAYSMVGAASGVLASLVLTRCLEVLQFPLSFRYVFLMGLVSALVATGVVSVGVKEVTEGRSREKIKLRDIFPLGAAVLKENRKFRNYTLARVLVGLAEFAIPYFIISASRQPDVPSNFVGVMVTIFLVAKMVGSFVLGRIGDRFGAIVILRCACLSGAIAAFLAAFSTGYLMSYVMYAFLAVAVSGVLMSLNIACITYSGGKRTPIYAATVGLLCAPLYILAAFGGAAIVNIFSFQLTFIIAMLVYLASAVLTFILNPISKEREP